MSATTATREELIALRDASRSGDDQALEAIAEAIEARIGADGFVAVGNQVVAAGAEVLLAELGG